jgi:predicted metal-binding membrane protein
MRIGAPELTSHDRRWQAVDVAMPMGLLTLAVIGWWWSARMASDAGMTGMDGAMESTMSLGGFVLAWVAMMAAMMLPAVLPVVRLYARAAAHGRAAPTGFFALGYLMVWGVMAAPAYFAWRALDGPLAEGQAWVARLAGATFLVAAVWQLTPLKTTCLRHCRSPLGFFMRFGRGIDRPLGAARMGLAHGAFCFGCCWPLFAVLVVLGTMNLGWMVLITAVVALEKLAPRGEAIAVAAGAGLAAVGVVLLADTSMLIHLT